MTDEKRKEVLELLIKGCSPGSIIERNIPSFLYKYRSGNDNDLNALENDSIWMGNATMMDDPLDSKVMITDEFRNQIKYVVNNVDRFKEDKYKIHLNDDSIQKECFLCSLSEINDSEDMWKRYANDEQGICIEYNAKELLAGINLPLLPVCYDKKISYDVKTLAALGKAEMIFINFLVKDKVGIHGEDWHSQREWRIIAFPKNLALNETEKKGKCIRIIKPTKIILGKNISYKVKNRIMNWVEKAGNENIVIVQRE